MQTPNTWVFQSHQRKKKKKSSECVSERPRRQRKNISGREEMGRMIFQSQCENESETPDFMVGDQIFQESQCQVDQEASFLFQDHHWDHKGPWLKTFPLLLE